MKTSANGKLIIYYSFSGNNKLLAEYFARELNAPAIPIEEKRKRSGLTTLLDVFLKRAPQIKPLPLTLSNFNHIIFVAPIWNGKVASPLRSLLRNHRNEIKSYSFITISGGYEKTDQLEKIKTELRNLTGKDAVSLSELDVSDLFPKADRRKITKISRFHVRPEDLTKGFRQKIQEALTIQKRISI